MAIQVTMFPSDLAPDLSISFMAKEVNINSDFEKAYEDSKKQILSTNNEGGKKTLAQNLLDKSEARCTIVLPLPNSFLESVSHNWGKETGLASDVVSGAMDKLGSAGKFAAKAVGQTTANTAVRMPTTDPGFFQKYTGTEPREFNFSWDFVIKSKADANSITSIIKDFKMYSAPSELASNIALLAPNFWVVDIKNSYLKTSLMLQPMVIKSVAVNYTGSSLMEVYKDGTPKFINFSISLSEISAITRQTYGMADTISLAAIGKDAIDSMTTSAQTPAASDSTATDAAAKA